MFMIQQCLSNCNRFKYMLQGNIEHAVTDHEDTSNATANVTNDGSESDTDSDSDTSGALDMSISEIFLLVTGLSCRKTIEILMRCKHIAHNLKKF